MREIKFRAWWDGSSPPETAHMVEWMELATEHFPYGFWPRPENSGFTLMQYTGLKDKSGVEIYEGDIFETPDYPFYTDDGRNYLGEVYYWEEEAAFYYCLHVVSDRVMGRACGGILCDFSPYSEIEVIGNIYENPDLLGDQ